ncbi:MAG: hypothetical protein WD904_08240 [Dehalococcoidia bacterium]
MTIPGTRSTRPESPTRDEPLIIVRIQDLANARIRLRDSARVRDLSLAWAATALYHVVDRSRQHVDKHVQTNANIIVEDAQPRAASFFWTALLSLNNLVPMVRQLIYEIFVVERYRGSRLDLSRRQKRRRDRECFRRTYRDFLIGSEPLQVVIGVGSTRLWQRSNRRNRFVCARVRTRLEPNRSDRDRSSTKKEDAPT